MGSKILSLGVAAFALAGLLWPGSSMASQTSGPACDTVRGTAYVTFSRDGGKTLARVADRMAGNVNTTGLASLTPDLLYAEVEGSILRSRDGGCTWSSVGTVNYSPIVLTAAGSSRAYAWSDNASFFARIDESGITELRVPVNEIHGVGVDPANGRHVRVGGDNGVVAESFDGGESWQRVSGGVPTTDLTLVYRMVFDPANVDHILAGLSVGGAYVTTDGGVTWEPCRMGLVGPTNVFNIAISPADPNVVWAMGIYLPHVDLPWRGRYIVRSTDGGRSFNAVLRQNSRITLRNGPVMTAHPTDPNVLFFSFGTFFQGYGTDIYRFDARTGRTEIRHNDYHDVDAIVFGRSNPDVMYLGLESHLE